MQHPIKLQYMLEITIYPGGKSFQKIFPIGQAKELRKDHNKEQKEKAQKRLDDIKQSYEVKVEGSREI